MEEISSELRLPSKSLCDQLLLQRRAGLYCDVTLLVGVEQWAVPAHKAVLAVGSPYFDGKCQSSVLFRGFWLIFVICSYVFLLLPGKETGRDRDRPGVRGGGEQGRDGGGGGVAVHLHRPRPQPPPHAGDLQAGAIMATVRIRQSS